MTRILGIAAVLFAASLPAMAGEKAAPTFTLKDINGKKFDLAEKLGKEVVVINFFATWCAPCQAELPIMQRLHEEHAADGLSVVVISIDDPKSAAKVKPLVRQQKYTFPVLLDTQTKAVSLYNPKKIVPFTAVIDRSGNIRSEKFGFMPGDEEKFEAELIGLLEIKTATPPEAPPSAPDK